jgi:hypothetical protein
MPIYTENVKLMASQRLTDYADGGGRMSATEIVDGNVNNLFPDISRLDRVYGRVSLRKAFVSVQTADTQVYSGAHVILSLPAADPNVSVCLFSTDDPHDERTSARNRVESYVTVGPRFQGWFWGNQPQGSRAIILYCVKGTPVPDIGNVLCLFNNRGLQNEQSQYVRVTGVERTSTEFSTDAGPYSSVAQTFQRDIMRIEIGDPLRYTFVGGEITKNDALATSVYTTIVSDASKYYGVMLPTKAINKNDIAINVNSIFTHLVPSAQGESPMTDLKVGEAGPVVGAGVSRSISVPSTLVANGTQINFCRGIKPGSLSIVGGGGRTFTDKGDGILYESLTQVGVVDYSTGTVTFTNISPTFNTAITMTAIAGVEVVRVPDSMAHEIVLANRGYNYVAILNPLPIPGSVWVDYMAQGRWYRLRDNGIGILVPDVDGTGTGTINYQTGSLTLTCAALPDVESQIIFNWANPVETVDLSGEIAVEVAEIVHTLANAPVEPGSLSITWPTGASTTATATDTGGTGVISGNASGSINYSTGEIRFKPTSLPTSAGEYTIDYEKYNKVTGSAAGSNAGTFTFTLPQGPIKPGGVNVDVLVKFADHQHVYRLKDNGAGSLSAPGWRVNFPVNHIEFSGGTILSGITGTIDYVTRQVTIDTTGTTGSEWWWPTEIQRFSMPPIVQGLPPSVRFITLYLPQQTQAITSTSINISSVSYSYALADTAKEVADEILPAKPFELDLLRNGVGYTIVPGSVDFTWNGTRYVDRLGKLYRNPSTVTGLGAEAGAIDYSNGLCTLTTYDGGANTLSIHSMTGRFGRQLLTSAVFRTPGAPLRPGSVSILGVAGDGSTVSAVSDFDGTITGQNVRGTVDYEKGIVRLDFGNLVTDSGQYLDEPWYDPADVVAGKIFVPKPVFVDTLYYGCVAYSYIPLNADLIGLDAVRLPTDGRVPIVRVGDVVVVHNTQTTQLSNPLTAGQVITLPRENIVHVELYDSASSPQRVPTTKFAWNKETQRLTMADPLDLAGFTQPLIAMHRIEDMALVSGVEINGQIILGHGVENDYPVNGTYVSSALLFGDLQARIFNLFDQATWTSVWSDALIGSGCNASYNEINYPPQVTNAGATKGRWALRFTDTTSFQIIEEKLGILGTAYITQDCAPINPATGQPFFFLDYRGWGTGWAAGNVVRFNTDGPNPPLWIARTTLQGPVTEPNDQFTIQIRGDAE